MAFNVPSTSIARDGETIEFQFDGGMARAEHAGAHLVAEHAGDDRANLIITDAAGDVIADVMVRRMLRDETITQSVINIGSALLWSHGRWVRARVMEEVKRTGMIANVEPGRLPDVNGDSFPVHQLPCTKEAGHAFSPHHERCTCGMHARPR